MPKLQSKMPLLTYEPSAAVADPVNLRILTEPQAHPPPSTACTSRASSSSTASSTRSSRTARRRRRSSTRRPCRGGRCRYRCRAGLSPPHICRPHRPREVEALHQRDAVLAQGDERLLVL